MNIDALFGMVGQLTLPEGQGATFMNSEGENCFSQLLETFILEEIGNSVVVSPAIPARTTQPVTLSKIFGQHPIEEAGLTPDLLEEASTPGSGQGELKVTLTELMAALQPIVNASSRSNLPSLLPANGETDTAPSEEEAADEIELTVLPLLAGSSLVQPVSSVSPSSSIDVAAITAASSTSAPTVSQEANDNRGLTAIPLNNAQQNTQQQGVALYPRQPEAAATLAQAADLPPAPVQSSFSQELAQQANSSSTRSEIEKLAKGLEVENLAVTGNEPALQPPAELPLEQTNLVFQPDKLNMQPSISKVETAETGVRLPDIPALHQIVEKISLMNREGSTEVRLHLQPESLGRVLIQLHLTNGDVSVRMLAETVQSQSLIQDHLPQLKSALMAQGLQLNNLAVAIGSDASAFDMHGRQPNGWSRGPSYQGHLSSSETDQPIAAQPPTRPWGSRHAVDYQI